MNTDSLRSRIIEEIAGRRIIFNWNNYGRFYDAGTVEGTNAVVKVFTCVQETAVREHDNLSRLYGCDNRLRVPKPLGLVPLGKREELFHLGLYALGNHPDSRKDEVLGVVMERLPGVGLDEIACAERLQYKRPVRDLLKALRSHRWHRYDLKPREVLCHEGAVSMVDTHTMNKVPWWKYFTDADHRKALCEYL
jgi:hypothetical protein